MQAPRRDTYRVTLSRSSLNYATRLWQADCFAESGRASRGAYRQTVA